MPQAKRKIVAQPPVGFEPTTTDLRVVPLVTHLGHLSLKIANVEFNITVPPGKIGTFMSKT